MRNEIYNVLVFVHKINIINNQYIYIQREKKGKASLFFLMIRRKIVNVAIKPIFSRCFWLLPKKIRLKNRYFVCLNLLSQTKCRILEIQLLRSYKKFTFIYLFYSLIFSFQAKQKYSIFTTIFLRLFIKKICVLKAFYYYATLGYGLGYIMKSN